MGILPYAGLKFYMYQSFKQQYTRFQACKGIPLLDLERLEVFNFCSLCKRAGKAYAWSKDLSPRWNVKGGGGCVKKPEILILAGFYVLHTKKS